MLPFRGPLTISRVSVLAWRIPGTGKPGGLPSMGSHRVGHDWSDLAAAAAAESVLIAISGVGGEGCCCHPGASRASRVALVVKKAPACAGRAGDVGSILGQEDLLEEEMATHCSILAWRIPMDRGAWHATVHGFTQSWTRLSDWAGVSPASPRAKGSLRTKYATQNMNSNEVETPCSRGLWEGEAAQVCAVRLLAGEA